MLMMHTQEVLALHRHAVGERSVSSVLRWVADRTGASVLLYQPSGRLSHSAPSPPTAELLTEIEPAVHRVTTGRVQTAKIDVSDKAVAIVAVGDQVPRPALVVVGDRDALSATAGIMTDVVGLLELFWRWEEVESRQRRMALGDLWMREAVVQLLLVGNVVAARRAAGALRPMLAEMVQVYLISCPPEVRGELADRCDVICRGRAWIVRCPVYSQHLIILAPAEHAAPGRDRHRYPTGRQIDDAFGSLVAAHPDRYLGSSEVVALRDVGSGYEQALDAVTRSAANADRAARYEPGRDLIGWLGTDARAWATAVLAPLLAFRTSRRSDPDAEELLTTLRSWLYFQNRATQQLKVHRNTLTARLRLIESLLKVDLDDLRVQAELHLAARLYGGGPDVRATSPHPDLDAALDDVLGTDAVRRWAQNEVEPLRKPGAEEALRTLQLWLAHDARLPQTAAALGLSVPATRKRLARLEVILGRTLLTIPLARYDLWLALRVTGLLVEP
jgi:hypothetical protein